MKQPLSKSLKTAIADLDADTYYAVAHIARMVFCHQSQRRAYRAYRVRVAAIVRQYYGRGFVEGGEDVVMISGQQVPAWSGASWKVWWQRFLDDQKRIRETSPHGMTSSYPMNAYILIMGLNPRELYTVQDILDHAVAMGFLSDLPALQRKIEYQIRNFRSKYLDVEPDHYQIGIRGRRKAWFGFRWQQALPERYRNKDMTEALVKVEKDVVVHPIQRHSRHGLNGWKMAAVFVALLVLAFAAGRYWEDESSDWKRYRQAISMDGRDGIMLLHHLLRDGDSQLDKVAIGNQLAMKLKNLRQKRLIDVDYFRELLAIDGLDKGPLIKEIADLQQDFNQTPIAIEDFSLPMFVAAIASNPLALYEEGLLRPGDWVINQRRLGYVETIDRFGLNVIYAQGNDRTSFQPVTLFRGRVKKAGVFQFWPGKPNLIPALQSICNVSGIDLDMGNVKVGHLGGVYYSESYHHFLADISDRLPIDYIGKKITVSSQNQFLFHFEYNGIWALTNVNQFLQLLIDQSGMRVEMMASLDTPDSMLWSFNGVQFNDFCRTLGLMPYLENDENNFRIRLERKHSQ